MDKCYSVYCHTCTNPIGSDNYVNDDTCLCHTNGTLLLTRCKYGHLLVFGDKYDIDLIREMWRRVMNCKPEERKVLGRAYDAFLAHKKYTDQLPRIPYSTFTYKGYTAHAGNQRSSAMGHVYGPLATMFFDTYRKEFATFFSQPTMQIARPEVMERMFADGYIVHN